MKKINFGLLIFILLIATSCVSSKKMIYLQGADYLKDNPLKIEQDYELRIQPDDQLLITISSKDKVLLEPFSNNQMLGSTTSSSQEGTGFQVNKEGNIQLPVLGNLKVQGLTRDEVSQIIQQKLIEGQYIKEPTVSVRVKNFKISVMGEVGSPGVKEISGDRVTVLEALSMAGDLTASAKRQNILIIREENGKRCSYVVDLTSGYDVLNSPYYYLRQNDVVYVEPNKSIRVKGSPSLSYLAAGGSIISVLASVLSLIAIFGK